MKKLLAFTLALALLLSGCGARTVSAETRLSASAEPDAPEKTAAAEPELRLQCAAEPLPGALANVTALAPCADGLWVGGFAPEGAALYCTVDGEETLIPLPEGTEMVYAVCDTPSGTAVLCGSLPPAYTDASGDLQYNPAPEGRFFLLRWGLHPSVTELTELDADADAVWKQLLWSDGAFFLLAHDRLLRLDETGAVTARYTPAESTRRIAAMALADGALSLAETLWGGTGSSLAALDPESLAESSRLTLDETVTGLGTDDTGGALLCTETGLFALGADGTLTLRADWAALYAPESFLAVWPAGEGWRLYARYADALYAAQWTAAPPRTELLLAADSGHGTAQTLAALFNQSQEDYFVRVAVYDTPEAQTRLRAELGAGSGPDILAFTQETTLAETDPAKLCTDLTPYLDGSDAAPLPALLNACRDGEAVYFLPYAFSIATFTAPASLIPEPGFTLTEAEAVLERAGGGLTLLPQWCTEDVMLGWTARMAIGRFTDRESGTARFDSPEFADLLTLCKKWSRSGTQSERGEQSLLTPELLQGFLRVSAIHANYGGDYCFAGFPCESGNGSMFVPELRLAVAAGSENAAGAWAFLRFALSPAGQAANLGAGFPASERVFDEQLRQAVAQGVDTMVEHYDFTQGDADRLRALIEGTTLLSGTDETLLAVITAEAARYLSGDKTAEEAAALIQSRASVYMAERYGA